MPPSARPVTPLTVIDEQAALLSSFSLAAVLAGGGDSMGEAMPFGERRERLEEWVVVLLEDENEEEKEEEND